VRAIAGGTVAFAGWKNNGGGYVVVIRHAGGMISTYNHNQSLAVRAGQQVIAGQWIARLGSTGNSTGPHLDLRVEMGGQLVDPLRFL
jgi:Membrane-bound metallopeptidase